MIKIIKDGSLCGVKWRWFYSVSLYVELSMK
jgi:hypothetical protein